MPLPCLRVGYEIGFPWENPCAPSPPSTFAPVINGGMPLSQTGDVGRESKLRDLFARHKFTNIWAKDVCWVDELTEVVDN